MASGRQGTRVRPGRGVSPEQAADLLDLVTMTAGIAVFFLAVITVLLMRGRRYG